MALSAEQTQIARLLYQLAVQRGIPPARAREFVNASYEESGLRPHARNRSSGAAGLFQLLSSGYVNRANRLGGVDNPRANALAILPDYLRYWQQHPNAVPGAAARDVERSGQGADFYSRHLGFFNQLGGGGSVVPPSARPVSRGLDAASEPNRDAVLQLINMAGRRPDAGAFIDVLRNTREDIPAAPGHPAQPTPHWNPRFEFEGKPTGHDVKAVELAKHFIGTPYSWGGGGPSGPSRGMGRGSHTVGFDCSSLLQYVWAQQGVKIPRTTYDQWRRGKAVGRGQLRPGDAVFFRGSDARGGLPGHVGIYIGNGKFIEAPHSGATVRVSKLAGRSDYQGARRYG